MHSNFACCSPSYFLARNMGRTELEKDSENKKRGSNVECDDTITTLPPMDSALNRSMGRGTAAPYSRACRRSHFCSFFYVAHSVRITSYYVTPHLSPAVLPISAQTRRGATPPLPLRRCPHSIASSFMSHAAAQLYSTVPPCQIRAPRPTARIKKFFKHRPIRLRETT